MERVNDLSVVVIGAGVIGLGAAWNLLRRGAAVTVVSSTDATEQIGWATMAWCNASSKVRRRYPDHYIALNRRGVDAMTDLAREIGGEWLERIGMVEIVSGPERREELAADVEQLRTRFSYPSELLSRDRLAQIAPNVSLGDGETAAFFPWDASINAPLLLRTLETAVSRAGARRINDRVVGFTRERDTIAAVHLDSGASVTADVVVLAAGAWTPDVGALAGLDVPVLPRDDERVAGLVAAVTPPAPPVRPMILSPDVILRSSAHGQTLLGSDRDVAPVDQSSTSAELLTAAQALLTRARARVPALAGSSIRDVRLGMRALPEDGLTIAGTPRGTANAYVIVTHSGFTLAALLGRLAAREICDGVAQDELEPYRPGRFDAG
jgi:glycine/D-amino acid oxidase-like deaminating enzyme